MNMLEQIRDGVYRIGVTLPQNPLRELNSYVICGDGRNLLIDTGFNRPECLEALQGGIRELGLDMECTDIFLTHLHSDHVGLASQVAGKGSRIYMKPIDNAGMDRFLTHPDGWGNQALRFLGEGFPPDELAVVKENNPGRKYRPNSVLEAIPVEDGTEIEVGGVRLKGIFTPGHTPGHTCLFCEEEGVLFTGDHVLFDITPNISIWEEMKDPLATYFVSLGKIAQLKVSLCLPGHRATNTDLQGRIQSLLHHHQVRLEEVVRIVKDQPGINGYEVAKRMTWSIRAKGWEDFPSGQKWFAVGEALTHLACLTGLGALRRDEELGTAAYLPGAPVDIAAAIRDYFEGRVSPK